jgi:hypothetical protein
MVAGGVILLIFGLVLLIIPIIGWIIGIPMIVIGIVLIAVGAGRRRPVIVTNVDQEAGSPAPGDERQNVQSVALSQQEHAALPNLEGQRSAPGIINVTPQNADSRPRR